MASSHAYKKHKNVNKYCNIGEKVSINHSYEKISTHLKKHTNTFSEELRFLIRLYEAIGFLGRNLRYSDSPAFYPLQ